MKRGNAENVLLGILTLAMIFALIYILNVPNSSETSSSYNIQINNYNQSVTVEQGSSSYYDYTQYETQEAETLLTYDNYKKNRFYYNQLSVEQKVVYEGNCDDFLTMSKDEICEIGENH